MTDKDIEALRVNYETLSRKYLDAAFAKREAMAMAARLFKESNNAHAAYMRARASARIGGAQGSGSGNNGVAR